MVKTILVPTDGSDHAAKAVAFAADLAGKYGGRLVLLHVLSDWGSERIPGELRSYAELEHLQVTERDLRKGVATEILERAEAAAREHGVSEPETLLDYGRPAKAILGAAKAEGADLIVMGSRGLGDARSLLLGSVSHKVSHLAECSCITVK